MKTKHRKPAAHAANGYAPPAPVKLDLACGQNKAGDGWVGVDVVKTPCVDVVHDLTTFPWPFADACVSEARCVHYFEHIPGRLRMPWMDELYRVLAPGGKCLFVVPYYANMRAVQDPTHEWPPVCEASFLYFNRDWRKMNALDHYPVACNFGFVYGYQLAPDWASRNEEARAFALRQYLNVAMDLHVTVTKEP